MRRVGKKRGAGDIREVVAVETPEAQVRNP
jgi:hypothetical protein